MKIATFFFLSVVALVLACGCASNSRTSKEWLVRYRKMDVNKNGYIDRKEFPGTDVRFTAIDHNNDGIISKPEFKAIKNERKGAGKGQGKGGGRRGM